MRTSFVECKLIAMGMDKQAPVRLRGKAALAAIQVSRSIDLAFKGCVPLHSLRGARIICKRVPQNLS